jgi:hypothetical protein
MGIHQIRKPAVQQAEETGFYNYQQASKYLGVPIARLRILQRTGKLSRARMGGHAHLFAKEELDRFRQQFRQSPQSTVAELKQLFFDAEHPNVTWFDADDEND